MGPSETKAKGGRGRKRRGEERGKVEREQPEVVLFGWSSAEVLGSSG